ncbi:hypothetical protein [Floridanema aerugineum]|uniref:Uncharacterized protein n=1 Tax=Floridaenema aerugineum BLCC-F46 TaxID=3153654 RepID=A0ABV4X749_9CYAN
MGILTACNAPPVPAGLATIFVGSIPVVLRVHNAKVKETENAEYTAQVAERLKALEAAIKQ